MKIKWGTVAVYFLVAMLAAGVYGYVAVHRPTPPQAPTPAPFTVPLPQPKVIVAPTPTRPAPRKKARTTGPTTVAGKPLDIRPLCAQYAAYRNTPEWRAYCADKRR